MDLQPQSEPLNHKISLVYHHLFSYPLSKRELIFWKVYPGKFELKKRLEVESYKGNYFIKGYKTYVFVKRQREIISLRKKKIAQRAALLLAKIPTVEFVGITGSLAMNNCKRNSDVDFIVVCRPNTLWSSRLLALLLLNLCGVKTRRAGVKTEKDLICMNMWMESSNMFIDKHNLYTAHELLQIKPLVDKNNIFVKLLKVNDWASDFWPNAYKVQSGRVREQESRSGSWKLLELVFLVVNPLMFWIQYAYMKTKITNEQVSYCRAFFHPRDGSEWVEKQLLKYGVLPKRS